MKLLFLSLVLVVSCSHSQPRKEFTLYQRQFLNTLMPPGRAFMESCYQTNSFHHCMAQHHTGMMMHQRLRQCEEAKQ